MPVDQVLDPEIAFAFADLGNEIAEQIEAALRQAASSERERMARELHDTAIRHLFATGLSLVAAASRTTDPELVSRLETAVEEIDGVIRELRRAIFPSTFG